MTEALAVANPIHKNGSLSGMGEGAYKLTPSKIGGLYLLKSPPPLAIPTLHGTFFVPQYPYERAIHLLLDFFANLKRHAQKNIEMKVAWVIQKKEEFSFYPPAFESRGLSLNNVLFFESSFVAKTLFTVCDENVFNAVVVVGPRTRSALQIGRRWLKSRDGPAVKKADALETQSLEKILIFIE